MKYRDPSTGNFKDLHFKVSDTLPIGTITQYGGSTAPEGWLICDGSAVSRTSYSALYAAIGTTYGVGNGSTTFNLPDLRGRVGVGKSSDTEFDTLGETGGEKTHTLTINEMPSHNHDFRYTFKAASGTSEWVGNNVNYSEIGNVIGNKGGGQPHNNLQPYIVTNYIIKAYQVVAAPAKVSDLFPVGKVEIFFDNNDHSNYLGFTWERIAQGKTLVGISTTDTDFDTIGETGGSKTHTHTTADHTLTTTEMPSHTHTGTTDLAGKHKHSLYFDRTSGSASGIKLETNVNNVYTTSDYVTEAGEHQHTFTTSSTGGGQAHNHGNTGSTSNLSPYIVVAYWKRVS